MIDNPFVGPSEMTFDPTKGGTLRNFLTHNLILANQKSEYFMNMYRWLRAHTMIDVTCVPAFVGTPDILSRVLSIC